MRIYAIFVVGLVGFVASAIGIFVFVSGRESIQEVIDGEPMIEVAEAAAGSDDEQASPSESGEGTDDDLNRSDSSTEARPTPPDGLLGSGDLPAEETTTADAPLVLGRCSESLGVIDFETISGGVAIEGSFVDDQYRDRFGIRFRLEGGSAPVVARVGSPASAFGSAYGDDAAAPGDDIGLHFLTDDGRLSGLTAGVIVIDYDTPSSGATGAILDIDFGEVFTVFAFDQDGELLDEYVLSESDRTAGDGRAARWAFSFDSPVMTKLQIVGTRSEAGRFGFGFDNFDPFCSN